VLIDHYIDKVYEPSNAFSRIMVREQVLNHTGNYGGTDIPDEKKGTRR